jgi:small subunit ribosomal protein S12
MVTLHQYLNGARRTKHRKTKTPAFRGCPQRKGTVIRLDIVKPKKPNSAKRRVAKVRLRNLKEIMAYIPGKGGALQKYADVLVRGGRVPDLPGVRYHLFRLKYDFTSAETFTRKRKRSKYGLKNLRKLKLADLGITEDISEDTPEESKTTSEESKTTSTNPEKTDK